MTLVLALIGRSQPGAMYIVAGSALFILANFLITVAFNVPMNDALAAVKPTDPQAATHWASYLTNWTAWNHVRTVGCLLALAALILGMMQQGAEKL